MNGLLKRLGLLPEGNMSFVIRIWVYDMIKSEPQESWIELPTPRIKSIQQVHDMLHNGSKCHIRCSYMCVMTTPLLQLTLYPFPSSLWSLSYDALP